MDLGRDFAGHSPAAPAAGAPPAPPRSLDHSAMAGLLEHQAPRARVAIEVDLGILDPPEQAEVKLPPLAPEGRVYLAVPFEEKDEAKAMGARWDGGVRRWFVPADLNPEPFQRWKEVRPSLEVKKVTELGQAAEVHKQEFFKGLEPLRQQLWDLADQVHALGESLKGTEQRLGARVRTYYTPQVRELGDTLIPEVRPQEAAGAHTSSAMRVLEKLGLEAGRQSYRDHMAQKESVFSYAAQQRLGKVIASLEGLAEREPAVREGLAPILKGARELRAAIPKAVKGALQETELWKLANVG